MEKVPYINCLSVYHYILNLSRVSSAHKNNHLDNNKSKLLLLLLFFIKLAKSAVEGASQEDLSVLWLSNNNKVVFWFHKSREFAHCDVILPYLNNFGTALETGWQQHRIFHTWAEMYSISDSDLTCGLFFLFRRRHQHIHNDTNKSNGDHV